MRLDGVEIKANVAGADVAAALERLELDDSSHVRIWFYEDLRAAVPPFPLFEDHLILRVRVKRNGDTDSTVKLRPCDRSRLTAQWLDTHGDGDLEFTLEQDRPLAGGPALAASCQVEKANCGVMGKGLVSGRGRGTTRTASTSRRSTENRCRRRQLESADR